MGAILYMFWDGFGVPDIGATITGPWANVIYCDSANQRLEIVSLNKRLEV